MQHCYVKFKPANPEALQRLRLVVDALISDMSSGERRSDESWREFFNSTELNYFWWPSEAEVKEWETEWFATPVAERDNPALWPRWTFGSMIESLLENEWQIIRVRDGSTAESFIEFEPMAYPFGGTDSICALIEAFGHKVVGRDDGSGYTPYVERSTWWIPRDQRGS